MKWARTPPLVREHKTKPKTWVPTTHHPICTFTFTFTIQVQTRGITLQPFWMPISVNLSHSFSLKKVSNAFLALTLQHHSDSPLLSWVASIICLIVRQWSKVECSNWKHGSFFIFIYLFAHFFILNYSYELGIHRANHDESLAPQAILSPPLNMAKIRHIS